MSLFKIQKDFLINEGSIPTPDIDAYIQSIEEAIGAIRTNSHQDGRRLAIAKENLKQLKRCARRIQQENTNLKEQISVLQES